MSTYSFVDNWNGVDNIHWHNSAFKKGKSPHLLVFLVHVHVIHEDFAVANFLLKRFGLFKKMQT